MEDELELKKSQEQGVIEPIKFSKWAAPIVPLLKHDRKSIRIYGDYKLTANKATQVDQFQFQKLTSYFLLWLGVLHLHT